MKWITEKKEALKGWYRCWFSFNFHDVHMEQDDIKKVPDMHNEYTCQRCGKIFKK